MEALIMMLHNIKEDAYHPIFYFEHPFPGDESDRKVKRFRSKGHRTNGFKSRQEALDTIESEVREPLRNMGYVIREELEEKDLLLWDGENIPADNQLRA
jgi:hypothetical protein